MFSKYFTIHSFVSFIQSGSACGAVFPRLSWRLVLCVTRRLSVRQIILTEKQEVVSRVTDDEPTKKKVSKKKLARQKREMRD